MTIKKDDDTYKPPLKYAIITSELDEDKGIWRETLVHVLYGDTTDEIQGLIAAHRKADTFFDGSFLGYYNDIKLKNDVIGLI